MEQVVILVGGKGTRLGPLTAATPKPLLEVGGRPFLDWLLDELGRHGFRRILLVAAHLGAAFEAAYAGRCVRGAVVQVLIEPEAGGTGGALRFALPHLDPRFLLVNGDSYLDIDLVSFVHGAGDALAHLALRARSPGARYGRVRLEGDRVRAFEPPGPGDGPINAGIYVLRREALQAIGPGIVSLEADIFPRLAAAGVMTASVHDRFFIDIGVPDDLARAQAAIPAALTRPAFFLDRDGVLNRDVGHAHRPHQIEWLPDAAVAVRHLNEAGAYVFVVTNQAGIARGYYEAPAVDALHAWMQERLAEAGAHVDAFAYCPCHPEGVVSPHVRACRRRKPSPGMLLDLMEEWPVDRERSVMIGDRPTDMAAAAAAGVRGVLYTGGSLLDVVRTHAPARADPDR